MLSGTSTTAVISNHEVPLREIARQTFVEMGSELRRSVLFLDRPSMDTVLWNLGFEFLLGLGIDNLFPLPPPADLLFNDEEGNDEGGSRLRKRYRLGSRAVFFVCKLALYPL